MTPCEKCWLRYSSYCVDCKRRAMGLGLINKGVKKKWK